MGTVTKRRPGTPLDDLRAELERRRLTVTEVAQRCGVSRNHLSEILWGRRRMTETLGKLMAYKTGIPLATILPDGQEATA